MNVNLSNFQALVFDLDNTLVATGDLFTKIYEQFRQDLLSMKKSNKYADLLDWQAFSDDFFKKDREYYMSGRVNLKVRGREIIADLLNKYLNDDELAYNEVLEQLVNYNKIFATVYERVPAIFPGTVDLLKKVHQADRDFIICTHSGDTWAAAKIAPLEAELTSKIPFFAVGLDEKKDEHSLLKALERLNWRRQKKQEAPITPEKVLMIGDNLDADIRSAKKAGFGGGILLNQVQAELDEAWQREFNELNCDWPLLKANSLFEIIDLLALT